MFSIIIALIIVAVVYMRKEAGLAFANSPLNAIYKIDGNLIRLVNGKSEIEAIPGSTSKIITNYFGSEVRRDFDRDGREDSVFILTQTRGESGIFYYVVPALNTSEGYVGGEALLLGDRIAPQTTEIRKNNIVVINYSDRALGEDFTVTPSVVKSIWIKLDPVTLQFGTVEQNFEGEADTSKMTLGMKSWEWIETIYNNSDAEVKPSMTGVFSITFGNEGRFTLKTDCNSVAGKYSVNGSKLAFSQMISTKMFCEGSLETKFSEMLVGVQSFSFNSKGELVLEMTKGTGAIILK